MEVFLGLGSNLGDRSARLAAAVASLRRLDADLQVSPVYETEPVGGPPGQPPYLNCVVRLTTSASPRQLLELARRLEADAGRVRTVRNGPRTLDVDVLLDGDEHIEEDDLVVPHPRMAERAFVLAPLEDLDPTRVPPNWRERLAGGPSGEGTVRRIGTLSGS